MNYTLEHLSIQGCLQLRIGGTWPHKNSRSIITDIFNIWEKHQKPMLLDMRGMEGSPSILGDYLDAEGFEVVGFGRVGRIAVLDNPERRKANDFFETAAHNRGLTFHFFYADEQEAIAWLIPKKEGKA